MNTLHQNIEKYHTKKLKITLVRGLIFSILLIMSYLVIISTLEYFLWMSSSFRKFLWIGLISVSFFVCIYFIFKPILEYFLFIKKKNQKLLLAQEIGEKQPAIKDKLVNTLQLEFLARSNELARAGLEQKEKWLSAYSFQQLIRFNIPRRWKKFGLGLVLICISSALGWPGIYREGTYRISQYKESFSPKAPFEFVWTNQNQKAFFQSEHKIQLEIVGDYIVSEAFIRINERLIRMDRDSTNYFSFLLSSLQQDLTFQFNAAGYYSDLQKLTVLYKPILERMEIEITPPSYTSLPVNRQLNNGNLIIQEGSIVKWNIKADHTASIQWITDLDTSAFTQESENLFYFKKAILDRMIYGVQLQNINSVNENSIAYQIDVIKDRAPSIECVFYADTVLYEYVILAGVARDDFGIGKIKGYMDDGKIQSDTLLSLNQQKEQNFYIQFQLTEEIRNAKEIRFYLSVWDNDAVNGPKETKTNVYTLLMPSGKEILNSLESKKEDLTNSLSSSGEKTKNITEKLEEVKKRLLTKPTLEWQEEKLLNEIVKQKEQLENEINGLNEKLQNLNERENKFNERSADIQQKAKELEKLMASVLDPETKKLYDELQELLKEKGNESEIRDLVSKLSNKEKNLEKELDRALELFKRLMIEAELDKLANSYRELSDQQKSVEQRVSEKNSDELIQDQEEINKKFEELVDDFDDLAEKNESLKNPMSIENPETLEEEIQNELKNVSEYIQNNKKKEAKESMKKASDSLMKMANQMSSIQAGMEMEMMEENITALENILDNLIKASFTQENLFNSIKEINLSDPRMITLSQEQLQLKENTKVLEDSLLALAQRVMSISNFVTREVNEVNRHLNDAIDYLRDRDKAKASTSQQFGMTSINNLALLLSDILKQMQMAMNEAMGNPSPGKGKPKDGLPSMQQLQEQLSQQIQQLKDGQKSGRQLSEELARMAAEQEMLRQQMEELKEQLKNQPGGSQAGDELSKAIELMEKNEVDLINKRLNQSLFDRQDEIKTRLLEAEKSAREQENEEERESEVAKSTEKRLPPAIEEYLLTRKKEIELIKNIPIPLNPFYKKEVNDYFRRLSNQQP